MQQINNSQDSIANIEVNLGNWKILKLLDSYIKLTKNHDSTLTYEQMVEEERLRTRLNSIDRRAINRLYQDIATRKGKKNDEKVYLLNLLLEGSLESRLYFPRIMNPEIHKLGEAKIYSRLEGYLFEVKNAVGEFTPPEIFRYDEFGSGLDKVIKSKLSEGHRGDHLTEEVVETMLIIFYNRYIVPMNKKSFKSMYSFFQSIDELMGDDLITVMCNSFEKINKIRFESMKREVFWLGFEYYALAPKERVTG